jgi:hypothetical protein
VPESAEEEIEPDYVWFQFSKCTEKAKRTCGIIE